MTNREKKCIENSGDRDPALGVIVPTLDAARGWSEFASALSACVNPRQVLIIDSESVDGTPRLAEACGFRIHSIRRSEFNHGRTRQIGAEMLSEADILVYLTQDAIPETVESIATLVAAFGNPQIAVAYGRQLPRRNAGAIEAHSRFFNYPDQSSIKDIRARERHGFKTIFVSNSFAAYRRRALLEVGGFPTNVIFGEDTVTAARLLCAGYKVAYVAGARVYHSHGYSLTQEFKRYFDIGVLHNREHWLIEMFGGAGGEGRAFVLSELDFLLHRDIQSVPSAMLRTLLKYGGYRLGRLEGRLPLKLKRFLSMHRSFWYDAVPDS
jgi:rhamnosyltransferase